MSDLRLPQLLLSPRSKTDVEAFLSMPSHALLLLGPSGSGKKTLALAMLSQLLDEPAHKVIQSPNVLKIDCEGSKAQSIGIDQIRQAQAFVRLKSTGHQLLNRAILLLDAHLLTIEAQNAFLKLLEEPPVDTVIVLTASSRQKLLPTILSRTSAIQLTAPPEATSKAFFTALGHDPALVNSVFHMSRGLPGLMAQLLGDQQDNYVLAYIAQAKQLLQLTTFDRLVMVDELIKKKSDLDSFLWALQTISQAGLSQALDKNDQKAAAHWHKVLAQTSQAQADLPSHPQSKLLLTNLCLHL
ncbi:MAG: AAA family ATPase [Candidatus Saccharimonadales bacterium]